MTKSDRVLIFLLRYVLGIPALFAVVAVFMPLSWMAATHRWLGLGEMPTAPVVDYLARSVSAFYVLLGAFCLVIAADLERYRPLVRFLALALAAIGIVSTGIDLAAGMPWWWTACEGLFGIGVGLYMYVLTRSIRRDSSKKVSAGPG